MRKPGNLPEERSHVQRGRSFPIGTGPEILIKLLKSQSGLTIIPARPRVDRSKALFFLIPDSSIGRASGCSPLGCRFESYSGSSRLSTDFGLLRSEIAGPVLFYRFAPVALKGDAPRVVVAVHSVLRTCAADRGEAPLVPATGLGCGRGVDARVRGSD